VSIAQEVLKVPAHLYMCCVVCLVCKAASHMVPTTHVAASNSTIFGLDNVSHPPSGYKVPINQLAMDNKYRTPSGSTDEHCHWVNQSLLDELVL
jgi:hypothetical protein